jgi:cobalamin biosynthesis protein CobT
MAVDHEMQRVGRIIAADQALDVSVRGIKAFAVPGRVTIPNIEHFAWLGSRYARRMLHGLLDHECGHASDTDFDALANWRKSKRPCKALDTLQNLVEDGYVERLQGARYRGSATNIRLMNEWFYEEKADDGKTFMDRMKDPADLVTAVLGATGTILTPHGHRTIEFYERLNPEVGKLLRLIEPELREAQAEVDTKQTQHNIDLAERIFAKLKKSGKGGGGGATSKDGHTQQPGEGQPGEGQPGEGQPGEGEPGDGKADGKGKGEPGDGDKDKGDGDGESDTAEMDLERWSEPGGSLCAADHINVIVRNVFDMPDHVQPYMVFSHEFDAERDFSAEDMADQTEAFKQAKAEAREVADAMIFAFEAALRSTAMVTPVSGADEGEVDPELLAQYAVGSVPSDQLYVQMDEGESDETAVEIVVDCSGSMGGRKALLAQQAAIAMHMALQACMITHEITGFTTLETSNTGHHPWAKGKKSELDRNFREFAAALGEAEEQGVDTGRFARAVCGWGRRYRSGEELMVPFHAVFKSWHSNDARSLMNIEGIDQNLDGEAVMWAARRLAVRPERRKVMFVISDGYPAGSRDNAQGNRYLVESVRRVIHSGMEIYGIGICSDAVEQFYPLWWRADDADDLISIAMTGLTTVLTQNRRERARVFL